jgi:hypothetical protein
MSNDRDQKRNPAQAHDPASPWNAIDTEQFAQYIAQLELVCNLGADGHEIPAKETRELAGRRMAFIQRIDAIWDPAPQGTTVRKTPWNFYAFLKPWDAAAALQGVKPDDPPDLFLGRGTRVKTQPAAKYEKV